VPTNYLFDDRESRGGNGRTTRSFSPEKWGHDLWDTESKKVPDADEKKSQEKPAEPAASSSSDDQPATPAKFTENPPEKRDTGHDSDDESMTKQ